ncbi:2-dehydropantoate 2-reductase [Burkholderia humptydooensis]|uniref:2-dehydropantoate 2-reductase n=2 Tax=Burkholderia humptydooensis TaxID=430531 RepID=A0A7U4STB5_9BURK|nr:2-dehydropantoate 2-reductase [Burkholderia humptydooensis]EIP90139.1 2-dehydropantoate 2-reductase [Burkholderia humptydooensis MSMB43]QPS44517.1 2-dehydropantoate 2-reductase [Burkholderia humptydooensis]
MTTMKIAMLGAGAMGSLFGGLLAEGGHDVTLVDANAAHVDAPPELVIVFTKTLRTRAALAAARELGVAVPHVRTLLQLVRLIDAPGG